MKKIILFIVLLPLCATSYAQKDRGCLKANIFFVLDWSASFDEVKFRPIDPIQKFINTFELDDRGVKVGIVLFGDDALLWSPLSSGEEILKFKIKELYSLEQMGNTHIEEAFPIITNMIKEDQNLRNEDVLNLVIVVSDGGFSSSEKAINRARLFRSTNANSTVMMSTVFVYSGDANENNLKKIADDGFHFWEDEISLLFEMIRKLNICL